MNKRLRHTTTLLAEDDPDDRLLTEQALKESSFFGAIKTVSNGEDLINYLKHQGDYADTPQWSLPDLILLDLNMPRKDGREALAEIKKDPALKHIPIVVLTTSCSEEDIQKTIAIKVHKTQSTAC